MKLNYILAAGLLAATAMSLTARDSKYTRRGAGPMYWMAYEECFVTDRALSEARYKMNVDWVADNFKEYGFDMICTDGWIEQGQTVNRYGYITKYASDWQNDWAYWIDYNRSKGLKSGIYYNPFWMTRAAYDRNLPVKGTQKNAQDIAGSTKFNDFIYWVDAEKEGAEQWVKGYVQHFIDLGFDFLRVDFVSWYENAYGRESYIKMLKWISEACGDKITFSLVMPNCFDHAAEEMKYCDVMRISEDVFGGGFDFVSGRRRGVYQEGWANWGNAFDGFIGFSDVAGRGQFIMDGDFIRLNTAESDSERQFWVSLMAITGSPIAIADQYDTIGENAHFYQNEEILALNKAGFAACPLSMNCGQSRSSIWIGQLPDGDWVAGMFNREDSEQTMTVSFSKDLGFAKGTKAMVRDLWRRADLGEQEDMYRVSLQPHSCVVVRIKNPVKRYQCEVAGTCGGAKIVM